MKKNKKNKIKEKIKDYLKLMLLTGIITTLWVIACTLASLV